MKIGNFFIALAVASLGHALALDYNLEFQGLGGLETGRNLESGETGPDFFITPEISGSISLPKIKWGRPEIFADYSTDLFLNSAHNHSFELGSKLMQPKPKLNFFEEVSLGYSRETGNEDLDNLGSSFYGAARGGFKTKWKHPLRAKLSCMYTEDFEANRRDIKLMSQVSVSFTNWPLFRPSVGLNYGRNFSDSLYTYNFVGLQFYGIYFLNDNNYLLGAGQLSNRSYPLMSQEGGGQKEKKRKASDTTDVNPNPGNGNGGGDMSEVLPRAQMTYFQLNFYHIFHEKLEWVVGGLVMANFYSENFGLSESVFYAFRLESGLVYQF